MNRTPSNDQDPRPDSGRVASRPSDSYVDPQRVWQLVRRRKFFLILPIVVIGAVVGIGVQTITPVYISTCSIHIEERSTGTDIDRIMLTPQMQRVRQKNRLAFVFEKFRSQELMLRVIRNLHLREDPGILAEATRLQQTKLPDQTLSVIAERILVHRLRQKIRVRTTGGDIYLVSIEDNDPDTAYKLNEAITQAYIDQIAKERYDEILSSRIFTDERLDLGWIR